MAEGPKTVPEPALKPAPAKKEENVSRRNFITWLAVAWGAFTAAMGVAATATMRFMFPNVLFEPPATFKAGFPEDYAVGKVDERWKERQSTWIVRTPEIIYALSTTCTHLGCTPNWLEAEGKFKCPCHGSGFYPTGINFEGPAPRPLERWRITIADDGQLVIDKSKKYEDATRGNRHDPGL